MKSFSAWQKASTTAYHICVECFCVCACVYRTPVHCVVCSKEQQICIMLLLIESRYQKLTTIYATLPSQSVIKCNNSEYISNNRICVCECVYICTCRRKGYDCKMRNIVLRDSADCVFGL